MKNIVQLNLDSTALDAIAYSGRDRALYVRFTNLTAYVYREVPSDEVVSMLNAPSHGKYFSSEIRDKYPATPMSSQDFDEKCDYVARLAAKVGESFFFWFPGCNTASLRILKTA